MNVEELTGHQFDTEYKCHCYVYKAYKLSAYLVNLSIFINRTNIFKQKIIDKDS
ncbi:hypothetical protein GPUN_2664 [Glaciecola punicea ACAM 611]|uniref:Uncharacterized protein n=1 Tax=Glaciecola punicea ACAM 611 TaxID=1121923 RepID=H5TEQ1_9ALTE|nr:hypothetical protein GPUN_2664 [Glaciecola punicea ACAM 611]